ncbi:hypothetical protein OV208_06385 [Corallococcus sp. bb12-1]|uniref:hypothetical protein n=1 Tax=Corallococcus sp. bb12-1 TaxID=2996784 RepID=UPI0022704C65|nr:hypothetical protein [Corallococcus sp. bb12-1]MCY1040943.1 hypothetical protein [Corallococcus sp. bb12-1]
MVLVYGLAVAPVLHAVVGHGGGLGGQAHVHGVGGHVHHEGAQAKAPCGTPAARKAAGSQTKPSECVAETGRGGAPDGEEGSGHDPMQGQGHRHHAGSVEHLLAVVASWTVFVPPALRWVSWTVEPARGPEWSPVQRLRSTAMPQGP